MIVALLVVGCERTTGKLGDDNQRRFEAEGILRRGVDLDFRRTQGGDGHRTWKDGYASIIVTRSSVVIHSNDRFLLEITPRSTGRYELEREQERLSLHVGRGQSTRSWSFRPPEDPAGWAEDIRGIIRQTAGALRRGTRGGE